MWWSPDPRMILFPEKLKVSKSLRQSLNDPKITVTFDKRFSEIVNRCSTAPRKDQDGTWITPEMKIAYESLYKLGFAHSVETWFNNQLVGGLYGISIGYAFFGESMFFTRRDASKIALYHLTQRLIDWGFYFIDAQVETDHLQRMGAQNIPRIDFLNLLKQALKHKTKKGKW
jgi:leucyl/phenylalanyl-tRNA--protein transferase